MRSWMIAFSLGIIVTSFIPEIPQLTCFYPLLIIPLLAVRFSCLHLTAAFATGIFWALLWAHNSLDNLLPKELEGRDIWVIGRLSNLPQESEHSQRFEFTVSQLCPFSELAQCDFSKIEHRSRKLLLNHYGDQNFSPGEQWRLKLRLKRPHGFSNPGGFDYEAWLFQRGISATGYIRTDSNNQLQNSPGTRNSFPQSIFQQSAFNTLRFQYRKKLRKLFAEKGELSNRGLIQALSIGDRYEISNAEWDLFSATGTNHLMVISGLHIGLVALLIYRGMVFLLSFCSALILFIPAQRLASVAAVTGAFFYSGLAGFSLPTQRAFIMILILMWGKISNRETSVLNSFCLALAVVLLIDPLAAQGMGFWLSFTAVGVLIMLATRGGNPDKFSNYPARFLLLVKAQLYLFVGLLPLMLFFFQRISLLAPLVNLLAIPLISLLVVPLCLAGLTLIWFWPALAKLSLQTADSLLEGFIWCLQQALELFTGAVLELPSLSLWQQCSLIIAVLMLLGLHNLKTRVIALIFFLPLFFPNKPALAPQEFNLTVLDVGQGLATVVETASHTLIYDVGPVYSPRFNAGSGVLIPFIRAHNIRQPDTVIISHGDNDHAGGLPVIMMNYPGARYLTGDPGIFPDAFQAEPCRQNQHWEWDGIQFEILHPDERSYNSNNSSCVLKISTGVYSALLTGDIERSVEIRLSNSQANNLRADILIAPHHGSKTSSTARFLATVIPTYAVFSSGYLNRFKHPHPEVLSRYEEAGITTFNTAELGAVTFQVSAMEGIQGPLSHRQSRKRYWSSQLGECQRVNSNIAQNWQC